jgi:hypothetical protein
MIYGAIASHLRKGGGRPGKGGLAFKGMFPLGAEGAAKRRDTRALTKENLRDLFGIQQNRKQGAAKKRDTKDPFLPENLRDLFGIQQNRKQGAAKKRDTKAPTLMDLFQGGFAGGGGGMLGAPGLVFPGYGGYGNTGNMWMGMGD